MADRALRGMGLGSTSFAAEDGVQMAERQHLGFDS
ncbi:RNA polymerase-binding protein RbpA, partial [Clostridioides difficile]|nr:RNA polymerase-binding protein RbpA [Clostridioides difficile]